MWRHNTLVLTTAFLQDKKCPKLWSLHKAPPQTREPTSMQAKAVTTTFWNSVWSSMVAEPEEHLRTERRHAAWWPQTLAGSSRPRVSFWHANYRKHSLGLSGSDGPTSLTLRTRILHLLEMGKTTISETFSLEPLTQNKTKSRSDQDENSAWK